MIREYNEQTMEHFFTTYIRTKNLFKHRLKDLKNYDTVKIYVYEMKKLGVDYGPLLFQLKEMGEIWYDNKGNFKALKPGPIEPELLKITRKNEKVKATLTPLHIYMRHQLLFVELEVPESKMPVYFKAFMEHRKNHIDAFFTVDAFSGRVHTPIVNLKGELRKALRFYGNNVVSLDVKQMQPTILAKVLNNSVGKNAFSDAIFDGKDVYILLQEKNKLLKTREEAKKFLFQLIFGKPIDRLGQMFEGDNDWVKWINEYKSRIEPNNPHAQHTHTNLAWLLQYSEVRVMTDIWRELQRMGIPFLTIHDDILCQKKHKDRVYHVMDEQLKGHFKKYTIVVNEKKFK